MFSTMTVLALAAAAAAQTTIQVGGAGGVRTYTPSTLTAANGTVVTFDFSGVPGNHTVTQSSFADPCNPLSGGFDSGWLFVNSTTTTPTWNLTITDDSKPIWFYCKQLTGTHCSAGMVGAINAPTTGNTYQAFVSKASSATSIGQGEGGLVGVGASASAPPSPLTGAVTGFSNPTGAAAAASGSQTAPASGSNSGSTSPSGSSSASPSSTSSAARPLVASGALAAFAAIFGIALV